MLCNVVCSKNFLVPKLLTKRDFQKKLWSSKSCKRKLLRVCLFPANCKLKAKSKE